MIQPTEVEAREGYRIWLRYQDGTAGEIDLSHLAGKGVFKVWDEPGYFAKVHITPHRTIAWDDDIDLCADDLYMELTGKSVSGNRPTIDYGNFSKALKNLELQHDNYKNLDDELPELMKEAVAESVIQRFETCYDCLWKVLKRYLTEDLGIPDVPNSPKPILKLADENDLFDTPLEQWLAYAEARIDTAHDYSGEKAQACLEITGNFIDDAIGLYQTMSGETWE